MAPRTINQRISLEGGEQIRRSLQEVGQAGERAFRQIQSAARNVANTNIPTDQIKRQLAEVGRAGEQAFRQIRQSADQVRQTTAQANQPIQQQTSFFSTLLGRVTLVAGAVTALAASYLAAARSASQATVDLGRQADAAKLSITSFQNLRGTLTQLNLTEDEAGQAANKLRDALRNAFDEGKAALEKFGVRFPPVTAQVQKFGAEMEVFGARFISGRNGAQSLAEQIEALGRATSNGSIQLSETTRALLEMRAVFDPLTGKVREGAAAWFPFAEGVRRMKDEAAAARLVNSIFGEEIGRILLPAIRSGNDEFTRAFESVQRLSLGLTDAQRKIGQDFVNAWTRLGLATKQARTELGLAFAPLFTPGINAFADALRRNQVSIARFVDQLVNFARPAIEGFFKSLTGFLDNPLSFDRLRDAVVSVGTTISQIVGNVIVPAFRGFLTIAGQVATAINNAFGTNLTPALVAVGALVTALIGPFNALLAAVLAVFGGQGPDFDAFREKLRSIGIDVDALRATVGEAITAMAAEFRRLFDQLSQGGGGAIFSDLRSAIVDFATSVPGVILGIVAAFLLLRRAATAVAPVINRIFGTELSGGAILAIGLIGALNGAFTVLAGILATISFSLGIVIGVMKIFGLLVAGVVAAFGIGALAAGALVAAVIAAGIALFVFWDDIKAAAAAAWDFVKTKAEEAWQGIVGFFEAGVSTLDSIWDGIKSAASAAWDFIVSAASGVVNAIGSAFNGLVDLLIAPFRTAANTIMDIFQRVRDFLQSVLGLATQAASAGGGGGGFARGGYVSGPGSSTSDSIAAWLSRGEFVVKADAVRKWGVGFFQSLNSLRMPGFADGGLVEGLAGAMDALSPRPLVAQTLLASGGGAKSRERTADFGIVTLDVAGRRVPILTDADSVAALRRVSIRNEIVKIGREPN